MKKLRAVLCLLCLALLLPALARLRLTLPRDTHALVEKKYAGWSGVLRLWVCDGQSDGADSPAAWLNDCVFSYERAHEGVYVQWQTVDAEAIRGIAQGALLPPDMILFPPGLLPDGDGLIPLDAPGGLRVASGDARALPVALGGYLWAINEAASDAAPALPVPEPFRRWDVALLSLWASGRPEAPTGGADQPAPGDIDLGLTAWTEVREGGATASPESLVPDENAWRRFINGEAFALPVTQREIRRLQALSDQGRGPQWRLVPREGGFTDQIWYLGLVDRPDAEAQRALCHSFAEHLLSEDCQGRLHRSGLFSVTDALSGYDAGDARLTLEVQLRAQPPVTPPAFGTRWQQDAEAIVRKFMEGNADAATLWPQLRALLIENPNN